jgi:hypothetical protein
MSDPTTTNYGWPKPVVNADADAWGTTIVANYDSQDADLFAVAQIANPMIGGLTLSAGGGVNSFGIAAGVAGAGAGVVMQLPSAYTKTTATWGVGTANGSLDTGSIAPNTWYHVWLIQRVDTGVTDILISLSPRATH